ncbi:hypothetical protein C7S16_2326 [Burkholderia thailandensis]|uniref:Uncharacterized protein n=1 Tax=Burkholderia thailandensis TaxID=57975 RepID=A0AAW9D3B3_BURTH|nr:hypothetical protein [Burkholderia thailandensis]MDW9256084.1 hypothetical protein [Burkholderia thailandensis]
MTPAARWPKPSRRVFSRRASAALAVAGSRRLSCNSDMPVRLGDAAAKSGLARVQRGQQTRRPAGRLAALSLRLPPAQQRSLGVWTPR